VRLELDRSAPLVDIWLRVIFGAIGVAAVVAAKVFPFGVLPSMCGLKLTTGLPCLACGMTRSWIHLAHGHPLAAFVQNPLGALLFLATAGTLIYLVARQLGMPAVRLKTGDREAWVLRGLAIVGVVANWLYVIFTGVA
jgi:hypothetical protein